MAARKKDWKAAKEFVWPNRVPGIGGQAVAEGDELDMPPGFEIDEQRTALLRSGVAFKYQVDEGNVIEYVNGKPAKQRYMAERVAILPVVRNE